MRVNGIVGVMLLCADGHNAHEQSQKNDGCKLKLDEINGKIEFENYVASLPFIVSRRSWNICENILPDEWPIQAFYTRTLNSLQLIEYNTGFEIKSH